MVAFISALLVLSLFALKQRNAKTLEAVQESESGIPIFRDGEFRAAVHEAAQRWTDAGKALDGHNVAAAFSAFQSARSATSIYVEHYGERPAEPGVDVRTWVNRQQQVFHDALLAEAPRLFEALAAGDVEVGEVKRLVESFAYYGLKEVEQRFKAEEPHLLEARAKSAAHWLRVKFQSTDTAFDESIRRALIRQWRELGHLKLTFGTPMGPLEERATWKTLTIRADQQYAHYVPTEDSRQKWQVTPPEIPESVAVTFRVDGGAEIPTTWDRIGAIQAAVSVPDSLWVAINGYNVQDQADRVKQEKQAELVAAVVAGLEKLPEFQVFPGIDAGALALRRGRTLDLAAANALVFFDRPRLVGELTTLSRDPVFHGPVALLVITHEIAELGPWLAQVLPTLPPTVQTPVMRELQKKPWFCEYEPLVAMVAAPGREDIQDVLDVLRGELHVPKVRAAIAQQIRVSPQRLNWAYLYVAEAPLEDLRAQLPGWLTGADQRFGQSIFFEIANRDAATATRAALDLFESAPAQTQVAFLNHLNRAIDIPQRELTALLRKAVTQGYTADVRDSARQTLESKSYEPDCWDILRGLASGESDPRRRAKIEERLILNATRAHPEAAVAYLLTQLDSATPTTRDLAIGQLLLQNNPHTEWFDALGHLLAAHPNDAGLLRRIIGELSQHGRLRRGWRFDEFLPHLRPLLLAAGHSADPQVRRQGYELMGYAIKKGAPAYIELLKTAQPQELDPKLQAEIARQLATKPDAPVPAPEQGPRSSP